MLSSTELSNRIGIIRRAGKKLDPYIHTTAVECIRHFESHGDCTLLTNLMDALPQSSRKEGFKVWVEAHTPAAWNTKLKRFKKITTENAPAFLVEEADAKPFWEFTKEATPKVLTYLDTLKKIEQLGNNLRKQLDSDNVKDGDEAHVKAASDALLDLV